MLAESRVEQVAELLIEREILESVLPRALDEFRRDALDLGADDLIGVELRQPRGLDDFQHKEFRMPVLEEVRTVTADGRLVVPWVIQRALGLEHGMPGRSSPNTMLEPAAHGRLGYFA